jgi:hypothetical protein
MVNITHDDYFSYSSDTQKVNSLKTDINAKLCDDWKKRIVNLPETNVIRPEYYGGKDNTYEVFNVLEAWELDKDFYLGNVIKYVVRAGKKSSSVKQDLEKALVYLQKRIDTL